MNMLILFLILLPLSIGAYNTPKQQVLYNSIRPHSISEHLAFYELYPDTNLGRKAFQEALSLLSETSSQNTFPSNLQLIQNGSFIQSLVSLINKPIDQSLPQLTENEIEIIHLLSSKLPHKALKGHHALNEQEILFLSPDEIDLARGLFITQFGSDINKIKSYEAMIDLMALQIKATLPTNPSPEQMINAINQFIFTDMGFRFPPHSIYAKDIDLYTFLPSVLDSHRGVCLGVSILYLCLAQRLNLHLEMITPPGHIYVRYRSHEKEINIETTARGVHVDSEEYLGVDTKCLQQRTIKEVIGLAHMNQAAVYLQKEKYEQALNAYKQAVKFLPDDLLIREFMAYAYLFTGDKTTGERLLNEVKDYLPNYAVSKNTTPEDYLNGKVDVEGIKVIFKPVDEDRISIVAKKELLEKTIQEWPEFRAGITQLAVTWLQLHRSKEALEILEKYYSILEDDPEINYYMVILYVNRLDYPKAWKQYKKLKNILNKVQYNPKQIKEIHQALIKCCPE